MASISAPTVHQNDRRFACVVSASMPATASRIARAPAASPRSQARRPCWNWRRWRTSCDAGAAPGTTSGAMRSGARADRSGKNRSLAATSARPRARCIASYSGKRQSARSGAPCTTSARNTLSLRHARSIASQAAGTAAASATSSAASPRSSSSVKGTTASRPTIWTAPAAWCTWARACFNGVASCGAARNAASASCPRASAWSISPWTQDSGPTSKSAELSIIAELMSACAGFVANGLVKGGVVGVRSGRWP